MSKKNSLRLSQLFYFTILLLIIFLAFFIRFYQINVVPSGVYPDEAVNGIDALKANLQHHYQTFYTDNNGREGLFINLIALSFKLWGVSVLGLKFPSIVLGTLLVLGVFLLTYEIFRQSWRAGLLASYLVAVSFWATNFSRIAFRAILLPVVLTFSFYFLLHGWHYLKKHGPRLPIKKWKAHILFLVSGLIFGLGLHSYIAFRIAPAILLVLLFFLIITEKHFLRRYWIYLITFILGAFLTALPLLITFYQHPDYLESRSASVSVFSPQLNHGHPWKALVRSFGLSLLKYSFWGDQNWRHNYPPFPILNSLLGLIFLWGLFYTIFKFFHLLWLRWKHQVRDEKLYLYAFLLAWFFGMLAPEFFTAEGNPHALRAIGTLPVVYIFATIPFLWILGKVQLCSPVFRQVVYLLIFIVLISVGVSNFIKYHWLYARQLQQQHAFETNLIRIANYVKIIPSYKKIILITGNMQRIPVKLFNYDRPIIYVHPQDWQIILSQIDSQTVIILTDKDQNIIQKIKCQHPSFYLEKFSDPYQNDFYVLKSK